MTTRVVVADDQPLVRDGFRAQISLVPDMELVGLATTGVEAVELATTALPDVVLMDVRMPVMDGIEATRRITSDERTRDVRVLMLTTFDLDEYVYAALRAGASGFLLKDSLPEDLFAAIRLVAAGEALLAPTVTRRLISEFAQRPRDRARQPSRAGPADRPRARRARARRAGPVERRGGRPPGAEPGDGEDPREPDPHQARSTRPRAAGDAGLRVRAGRARRQLRYISRCSPRPRGVGTSSASRPTTRARQLPSVEA